MPGAPRRPWVDVELLQMLIQTREWALRTISGNPGRPITFNEFASSVVLLEMPQQRENMTRLKLRILDRYIALGHTLTEEERVEIEAEKATWQEQRRKARNDLRQFYADIGETEMLELNDDEWEKLLDFYGF